MRKKIIGGDGSYGGLPSPTGHASCCIRVYWEGGDSTRYFGYSKSEALGFANLHAAEVGERTSWCCVSC